MKTTLVFDGKHEILIEPQLNLLAHAQCLELDLGSQCGGHGVCGKDRIQVLNYLEVQLTPLTESEKEHLSEAETQEGIRLACQCFPNSREKGIQILRKKGVD